MKLVLGLGNPGPEYTDTRHNVGWWLLDACHDRWGGGAWKRDGEALAADHRLGTQRVRLVKPLTYMNLSGRVLGQYLRRPLWKASEDLLVLVDEVALPLAQMRVRAKGSPGGHNGLKDVQRMVGSGDYARLRIGIRPEDERRLGGDLADFVLGKFGKDEAAMMREALPRMADAVESWIGAGAVETMSRFN
jgi:peptidyl-tRNA hydrolase, PTH1 family